MFCFHTHGYRNYLITKLLCTPVLSRYYSFICNFVFILLILLEVEFKPLCMLSKYSSPELQSLASRSSLLVLFYFHVCVVIELLCYGLTHIAI